MKRLASTKLSGAALKSHRDARVNQKQTSQLARSYPALDRQSRRIDDLGSSIADDHASLNFLGASLHDQLYLRAGLLRDGAILRGDQPDRSDFASSSNPAWSASGSIHPTAAAGGSVSR
jgi:hypothetical protein